jgi:5,10-methylenetetrahydrofolate reductase
VASRHSKNRQLERKAKILMFDPPRTRNKIYRLEFLEWQHHAVTAGDHPDKTPSSEYRKARFPL